MFIQIKHVLCVSKLSAPFFFKEIMCAPYPCPRKLLKNGINILVGQAVYNLWIKQPTNSFFSISQEPFGLLNINIKEPFGLFKYVCLFFFFSSLNNNNLL